MYGFLKSDDKLKSAAFERLLPCIVDGARLPEDILQISFRRTVRPESFESKNAWLNMMEIVCALFLKYKKDYSKEVYQMSLDENRRTRDYLYGRLLGVADVIEERALYEAKEKRATAAERYFTAFSANPFKTWPIIFTSLRPYLNKADFKYYNKKSSTR
jgi:CRISPR-associated protein (Cas_Csd1).